MTETRRTKRRYAHEVYPHGEEDITRDEPDDEPRVKPTEVEVARVIYDALGFDWRSWANTRQEVYIKYARAVLALFADQHTVAQIKAEALREAAVGLWGDDSAERGTTKALHHSIYATWLQERAKLIESEG